jgi:hypothetical protein
LKKTKIKAKKICVFHNLLIYFSFALNMSMRSKSPGRAHSSSITEDSLANGVGNISLHHRNSQSGSENIVTTRSIIVPQFKTRYTIL